MSLQTLKHQINPLNIAKVFFFLFLISLFFPIRHVFLGKSSFETGVYSDFSTISLYLSDIFILTTWCWLILPRGREFYHVVKTLKWLILWVFLVFLMNFEKNWSLNLFFLGKILELIVAYGTIVILFRETSIKKPFLWFFTILTSLQSLIALSQFWLQHPLGLFKIGEQQVFPWMPGIAKIVVEGEKLIRGYGTFPHPNPLSAFLIVGIFIGIYLFLQSRRPWQTITTIFLILINVLGLTVIFSRAAFLAVGMGLITFYGYLLISKQLKKKLLTSVGIVLLSILIAFVVFKPGLLTRATVKDQATVERKIYNQAGMNIINAKPLFGIGIGESLLHMQQFTPVKLLPWQIQPVHNYYLLSAVEMGIIGSLILLWIFLSHLRMLVASIKYQVLSGEKNLNTYYILLATILICFLVLMLFDHYFYTLQQTQMLLWVVLGLIAAQTYQNKFYE